MATFCVENFGCRATQADAAAIDWQLRERGHARADRGAAELVIFNTCTVTAAADAQARAAIRQALRENPRARIIVTGCYAQRAPEEVAQIEGVACVIGNSHQAEISRVAEQLVREGARSFRAADFVPVTAIEAEPLSLASAPAKILSGNIFDQATVQLAPAGGSVGDRTRPTLKIQDGCNNRCSYCVIPFVRGRSRSLPPETALEEVRRLIQAGFKEIVLSGINLGSYGRDLTPRAKLEDWIRRVLAETSVGQLRLSSIEPMDVTRDFVELVAASGRIAPHFHMPLQSGSDRILRAMHRRYRVAHYERRLEIIRERIPEAGIGADVIAGFPGETEEDHRLTLDFIALLPFTYLHVFAFSPRPGTQAAGMSAPVPPHLVKRRARELRDLGAQKNAAFRASQVGRTLRVLTLGNSREDSTEALSGNYLKVRVAACWGANEWLEVRLAPDGYSANVVARPRSPLNRVQQRDALFAPQSKFSRPVERPVDDCLSLPWLISSAGPLANPHASGTARLRSEGRNEAQPERILQTENDARRGSVG